MYLQADQHEYSVLVCAPGSSLASIDNKFGRLSSETSTWTLRVCAKIIVAG